MGVGFTNDAADHVARSPGSVRYLLCISLRWPYFGPAFGISVAAMVHHRVLLGFDPIDHGSQLTAGLYHRRAVLAALPMVRLYRRGAAAGAGHCCCLQGGAVSAA